MLKKHIVQYSTGISILTMVFLGAGLLTFWQFNSFICINYFLYLILLFFASSLLFHFLLIYFFEKNPKKFIQMFLLLTVAKIFIYLTILVVFIFNNVAGIKCFLISFFTLYVGYTFYEVIMLTRQLKNSRAK